MSPRKPPLHLSAAQRDAHADACAAGQQGYLDPESGLFVMTEAALLRRGTCCGNACRHCPFDWREVDDARLGSRSR